MNDAQPAYTENPNINLEQSHQFIRLWSINKILHLIDLAVFATDSYLSRPIFERKKNYLEDFKLGSDGWAYLSSSLMKIKKHCKTKNVRLIVAIFPDFSSDFKNYGYGPIHQQISDFALSNEIEIVDLWNTFKQQYSAGFRTEFDGHPNAMAFQKSAKVLAAKILNE